MINDWEYTDERRGREVSTFYLRPWKRLSLRAKEQCRLMWQESGVGGRQFARPWPRRSRLVGGRTRPECHSSTTKSFSSFIRLGQFGKYQDLRMAKGLRLGICTGRDYRSPTAILRLVQQDIESFWLTTYEPALAKPHIDVDKLRQSA
jgi:hypothetical protein